jgi:hypothetical protein
MTKNGITERVTQLGDRARERMTHARLEKLDRDNDRLRGEVSLLRDDLQEERDALREALKALGEERVTVRPDRRPHVVRTILVAGTAYLFGTRAGRERYEWIVGRVRAMRDSVRGSAEDIPEHWDSSDGSLGTTVGSIDEGRRGTTHGA